MRIEVHRDLSGHNMVLDRIRPAQNERRFYALSIGVDLFRNIHLFRNWGRIGTGGRVRIDVCSGMAEAMSALEKLAHAKRRRGYEARLNGQFASNQADWLISNHHPH